MQRQEQAYAVLEQTSQQEKDKRKQHEVVILQTQKIKALEERLEQ